MTLSKFEQLTAQGPPGGPVCECGDLGCLILLGLSWDEFDRLPASPPLIAAGCMTKVSIKTNEVL